MAATVRKAGETSASRVFTQKQYLRQKKEYTFGKGDAREDYESRYQTGMRREDTVKASEKQNGAWNE